MLNKAAGMVTNLL